MAPPHKAVSHGKANPPAPKPLLQGHEDFKRTMQAAIKDPHFNDWDKVIDDTILEYDAWLKQFPGYKSIDARLVKAMILVESGGPASDEWATRPMQIGNANDPGLDELMYPNIKGEEKILPPGLLRRLQTEPVKGALNIKAGIGYIFEISAEYGRTIVYDSQDKEEHTATITDKVPSVSKVSEVYGTCDDIIFAMNRVPAVLHPGDTLKYKKGKVDHTITAFRAITPDWMAKKYNTHPKKKPHHKAPKGHPGDAYYFQKLMYILSLKWQ